MEEAQFKNLMDVIVQKKAGVQACKILHIIAYFASDYIHTGMFSGLCSNLEELNAAVKLLKHYSLVQPRTETIIYIHESIQTIMRKTLKDLEKEESFLKIAIAIASMSVNSIRPINICHAMSIFAFSKKYPKLIEESSKLPSFILRELLKWERSREASLFGTEAFYFLKNSLGTYHPEVLALQFRLAASLAVESKHNEALELLIALYEKESQVSRKREINDRVKLLLEVIMKMELSVNPSPEAEARLLKIVFGGVQISETKDNSVLKTWIEYAELLISLDSTKKALHILRTVVKRMKEILGPHDDGICEAMKSSAHALMKENKLQEALKTLQSIHAKRRKNLGEMNVKTLRTLSNIADVLERQCRYDEALTVSEEVAEKFKHVLGELHPLSMKARSDTAGVHFHRQEYEKAYEINTDLYQKSSRAFGKNNLNSLQLKQNIGHVLLEQNKLKEALRIYQEVLEISIVFYGPLEDTVIELKQKIGFILLMESESEAETSHSVPIGNLEEIKALIKTEDDLNGKNQEGKMSMHYAAESGDEKLAKLLMEKGAIYNARCKEGTTPLQLAKSPQMQKLLLTAKALFDDAKTGNWEKVLQHISKERSIRNVKDIHGYTALHWTTFGGHKTTLKLLLEFEADASLVSHKGNSPLHIAATKGFTEITDLLLHSVGRDKLHDFINGKTKAGGNTPLHVAAEKGFVGVVKTLLSNGAIFNIRNKDGNTAQELAKEWSCSNLLNLIDGLFLDARKGSDDVICKLRDMDSSELLAVSKARDLEKNTLLQVTINTKHQDLAMKLLKVLKYNDLN